MSNTDKARPNFIIILSLIGLWMLFKIIGHASNPSELQYTQYSVDLILSIITIIPTILLLILFVKKSKSAKIMVHITSIIYIISAIISYIQAAIFPSGNQTVTGPMKIAMIPIQFFGIVAVIFLWVILYKYLKKQDATS